MKKIKAILTINFCMLLFCFVQLGCDNSDPRDEVVGEYHGEYVISVWNASIFPDTLIQWDTSYSASYMIAKAGLESIRISPFFGQVNEDLPYFGGMEEYKFHRDGLDETVTITIIPDSSLLRLKFRNWSGGGGGSTTVNHFFEGTK